ncbi:MAG: FxsA family protein [Actinomycetota bacterium]
MLVLLLIAFVAVPIVELYVIIQVGQEIGILNTLGVMIIMSVIGAWLARHEGAWVLKRMRDQLDAGRMPTNELIDGALILAGGLLLLTPGFVSDAVGILLLFPPTRVPFRALLKRRFSVVTIGRGRPPDDVIDIE